MIQRKKIEASLFLDMMREGAHNLHQHIDAVNALNVFPVPDGDTGTNMSLTLTSGVKEMEKNTSGSLVGYAESLSKGLLMGARGNSGVILSQLFRGFSKAVTDKMYLNARQLADALQRGVQTAYKAVIKPVEGTILTVARQAAEAGVKVAQSDDDVVKVMEGVIVAAKDTLQETPNMLPVLKQAGVVDAGGQGFIIILQGMLHAMKGERSEATSGLPDLKEVTALAHEQNAHAMAPSEIEFGYCTEFIIRLNAEKENKKMFQEGSFRKKMGEFGDSLLVVADDEFVKVHIHAEYPGSALNVAMDFGDLISIKIDNMRAQNENLLEPVCTEITEEKSDSTQSTQKKPYGILAVASGTGVGDIFKSMGVDVVIEGGQSMNPSTEEMVHAIQNIAAEHLFIFPNNKNIILTAKQVQGIVDIPVAVLPTKTIPQGIAALLAFDPAEKPDANEKKMQQAYARIVSGEITHAVRDSKVDGLSIKEGDVLGIREGKIEVTGKKLVQTSLALFKKMVTEDSEIATLIYGMDVEMKDVSELRKKLQKLFPQLEIECYNGGQPLYMFLFSVE